MSIKMKKMTVLVQSALGVGIAASLVCLPAYAQQDTEKVERIEVTGSAIKRIQAEGALPITVITQEDIKKSGAISATDLIQKIPSMQGFIAKADSVNGGGGGLTSASLRSLGSDYTLVLLNGRRVAAANRGTTVNLESIPLNAIERVEVLTDGASAIYGADAIAGVVNFILKKNTSEGSVEMTANLPQGPGGDSVNVGISKGFGNVDKEGFNVLVALSYDEQNTLAASQRRFSKSGVIPFSQDGRNLSLVLNSVNSVPANIALTDGTVDPLYNPYFLQNGSCPPLHVLRGQACRFDFASTVDLIPESKRTSAFISGQFKLTDNVKAFGDVTLTKFATKPAYAPPAQPLGLLLTSPLYAKYVVPYLGQLGVNPADVTAADMFIRVFDAGKRQDDYTYNTKGITGGIEGTLQSWDFNAAYGFSKTQILDDAIGGYLSKNAFEALIAANAYDPFLPAGGAVNALAPAVLKQRLSEDNYSLSTFSVRGSTPLFKTGGGEAALALGTEFGKQRAEINPSAILQGKNVQQPLFTDAIIGGGGGSLPFDANRNNFGAFAELAMPLSKEFELNGAVRYDKYSTITNKKAFDSVGNAIGEATEGLASNRATYKLSARFQPSQAFLFRGSVGSGFRAPTLGDISNPVEDFGVTAAEYTCPFVAPDPLAAGCPNAQTQYNQVRRGNATTGDDALKPEKSKQWTIGFRVEPTSAFSFGLDYWNVKLNDQISQIDERVAFANPAAFSKLFLLRPDPISGVIRTNFVLAPINLASSDYRGIDFDTSLRNKTPIGVLSAKLTATYLLKADYEVPGLPGFQSSLGKYGTDQQVAFKWIAKLSTGLEVGRFVHTLSANYRTGYEDAPVTTDADGNIIGPVIRPVNANGTFGGQIGTFSRRVASYTTFDWQSKFNLDKGLDVTLGIKNLFDRDPPFSIQDGGTGNMRGYDPRYSDPMGRTGYITAAYKF
jgi:iron complex outermembrane recepter protein